MPDPEKPDESLSAALSELSALIKPQDIQAVDIEARLGEFVYYILLLWASFRVYQLEPYVEGGGGGKGGGAKVTVLDSGRSIYDYGYYLCTSPGEDYGSACTGKLIDSAHQMIAMLAKRGVKKVAFLGHPIAQRAAWIDCLERGIEITNFFPDELDFIARERVNQLREYSKRQAQTRKEGVKPG